ncbi:hypothetical protein IPM62_02660 [Candidatus Woesebacteria bacterium]|nr:MAG: hypothetical protein IPM62_02660 [Candidatus Woesebacteria bacterium]
MLKNIIKYSSYLLFIIVIVFLLTINVKGKREDNLLLYQDTKSKSTAVGTPFESSGSTSRFALTEAIVEDSTFMLNTERAGFASPDVTNYKGKYFSIFTPGVSFVGVPFYLLGKQFGIPQISTYFSTILFAVVNLFLIANISRKLGSGLYMSILCGLLFLFATNALSYAFTFTQHHASTSLILVGILYTMKPRTLLNNIIFGISYGIGLLMDIPNGIIMFPLVFYILAKQFNVHNTGSKLKLSLKLNFIGLLIGIIPLVGIFGWYNYETAQSYTTLAQFLGRSNDFTNKLQVEVSSEVEKKGLSLPFKTRGQLEGFYIFIISDQRSIFVYSPIIILGIAGLAFAYKNKQLRGKSKLLIAVTMTNLLIYTMFGDPTGSWAFGPRYLIPATAVLSITIGLAIQKYTKKAWFIPLFIILTTYSVGINVMGATTTSQVPPKVEAVNLPNPIPHTYLYNWQLMTEDKLNSSIFYNAYANKYMNSINYTALYTFTILLLISLFYTATYFENKKENL